VMLLDIESVDVELANMRKQSQDSVATAFTSDLYGRVCG
jgi:hypothetical protein